MGTTLNLINGDETGPLVRADKGVGHWAILAPRLSGNTGRPWIRIDPSAVSMINIEDVFPDKSSPIADMLDDRTFGRRWHAWDSSVATVDSSPQAVETVETFGSGQSAGAAGQLPPKWH